METLWQGRGEEKGGGRGGLVTGDAVSHTERTKPHLHRTTRQRPQNMRFSSHSHPLNGISGSSCSKQISQRPRYIFRKQTVLHLLLEAGKTRQTRQTSRRRDAILDAILEKCFRNHHIARLPANRIHTTAVQICLPAGIKIG